MYLSSHDVVWKSIHLPVDTIVAQSHSKHIVWGLLWGLCVKTKLSRRFKKLSWKFQHNYAEAFRDMSRFRAHCIEV